MAEKPADVINEVKAKAWNLAIAPRAPALLSFVSSDEWLNGIEAWLKSLEQQLDRALRHGSKSRDEDQFLRGKISMCEEILDLPAVLKNFIEEKANREKQAASRGIAGY